MTLPDRTYAHSMLREIFEQPDALRRTLAVYTGSQSGVTTLREELFAPARAALADRQSLVIAASGSSRHAGLVAEVLLEDIAGLPVDVEYASEYIYRSPRTVGEPGFLVLSQSGETVDTLQALREARTRGLPTLAITNHPQSTMARLANCSLPTLAGVELAVPATKSFTTQLLLLNLLALYAAQARGRLDDAQVADHLRRIAQVPALLEHMLPTWERQAQALADTLARIEEYVFLGRGVHLPIAREAALKLKESAYVHAEAYPAGELKHGPNAVLSRSSAIFVLATQAAQTTHANQTKPDASSAESSLRYEKTVSLVRDLRAQDIRVFAVATEGDTLLPELCEEVIYLPSCAEALDPMLEVVPLQLLAYFTAVRLGIDPDSPRHLAKAVLVE